MTIERITIAAHEVRDYWRDWPQERRDAVRALSGFLADAIEELALAVSESPFGRCGQCGRFVALAKSGAVRQHNGDICVGGFRQVCSGTGQLPAVSS